MNIIHTKKAVYPTVRFSKSSSLKLATVMTIGLSLLTSGCLNPDKYESTEETGGDSSSSSIGNNDRMWSPNMPNNNTQMPTAGAESGTEAGTEAKPANALDNLEVLRV